jgi:hypothetical protein
MKQALVIPIYQPNDKVVPFLKTFKNDDFALLIVVDDGSGTRLSAGFRSNQSP